MIHNPNQEINENMLLNMKLMGAAIQQMDRQIEELEEYIEALEARIEADTELIALLKRGAF